MTFLQRLMISKCIKGVIGLNFQHLNFLLVEIRKFSCLAYFNRLIFQCIMSHNYAHLILAKDLGARMSGPIEEAKITAQELSY